MILRGILLITQVSTALADAAAIVNVPTELTSPACIACKVDAARTRQGFADGDWKSLEDREVVIVEMPASASGEQREVRANAIIDRSPHHVWSVLTDFPSRPRFTPDVKDMRVVRVDGNRVWVDEFLKFLFVDIYFRVINTLEPEPGTMSWQLDKSVAHDIADTRGTWQLTPLDNGTRTLLSYWADVDSGQPIPAFIESYLMKSSLPGLLGRMRDEVERRFPKQS